MKLTFPGGGYMSQGEAMWTRYLRVFSKLSQDGYKG